MKVKRLDRKRSRKVIAQNRLNEFQEGQEFWLLEGFEPALQDRFGTARPSLL